MKPSPERRDRRYAGLLVLLNLPLLLARTPLARPLHLELLGSGETLFFASWLGMNLLLGWRWWRGRGGRGASRLAPRQRALLTAVAAGLGGVLLLATEGMLRLSGLYLSYSEANFGRYESLWHYRNHIPWLHLLGPNRARQWQREGVRYEIRTNREGLRDVDHPVAKSPGTYRILAVGSSYTEGVGAAFEDTYPQVLKRMLEPRPVEVMAAGAGGSDPVFFHQLISRRLLKYEPDLVVVTVNDVDVPDVVVRGGMDRFDADGFVEPPPPPRIEGLYRRSHLVRAVLKEVFDFNFLVLSKPDRKRRFAAAVPEIADALEAIRNLGEAHGFELLVVNNPDLSKLRRVSAEKTNLAALPGLLAERGIRYRDLREHFQGAIAPGAEREYYWQVDLHYNARGYALMASGVAAALADLPGFPAAGDQATRIP